MPELVRLYIRNVIFGAGLSALFVGLLLGFDVAHLRHLILSSDIGYIAIGLLFVINAMVFAWVQCAVEMMGMAEDEGSGGGKRDAIPSFGLVAIPIPVEVRAKRQGRRVQR